MNSPIWIVFSGQCINKFHICTVNALKHPGNEKSFRLQMSLSNGLVLEETFDSEEECGAKIVEITGGKS